MNVLENMLQNRKYDSERNLQRTLRFSGRKTALGNKQKQVTFRTIWNHKNPLWKFWDSGLKRSQSDYELLGIFKAWFSFKFASTFKNNLSNKIKPTKNKKLEEKNKNLKISKLNKKVKPGHVRSSLPSPALGPCNFLYIYYIFSYNFFIF